MIFNITFMKQGGEITIIALIILLLAGAAGAVPAEEWNMTYEGRAYSAIQASNGGYIAIGTLWRNLPGDPYNNTHVELLKTDANGILQWNITYGSHEDIANNLQNTKDGGYIFAGATNSYGAGRYDAWIIKTDINGKELWNQTFGGKESDYAFSVQQTPDDGYIIGGVTYSYGIDVPSLDSYCGTWLIKTDANGKELWNRTFGGASTSDSGIVKLTKDGGYILAGRTIRPQGGSDAWIIKTNSKGDELWNRTFGGTGINEFYSVLQASDGGYIIAGHKAPEGGNFDAVLIKLDANGNIQWTRTYGGTEYDGARSVQQTSDGGYIFAGSSREFELDSDASQNDAWLVKTDANGNEEWNRTYGGANDEEFHSLQQTSDGGYILAGVITDNGKYGVRTNFWLVKVGPKDEIIPAVVSTPVVAESPEKSNVEFVPYLEEWNKTFGGAGYDTSESVEQTSDGGYILAGVTLSFGAGNDDAWIIKTDSNGNELWNRTFERYGHDWAKYVQQTKDGGYILAGGTYSSEDRKGSTISYPSDVLLIKTDANGNKQWGKTFGGNGQDDAFSVQQTSDDGYIIAGKTYSDGTVFYDAWLIKTDVNGDRQWSKTYGGEKDEVPSFGQQTIDGGYIIGGMTLSFGAQDAWLVKTDTNGNELWNRTYGGIGVYLASFGQQTSDGGYILVGNVITLLKTDANGDKLWNKTFTGTDTRANSLKQTSDGGYIIIGSTGTSGNMYSWLIKTDADGNKQWNITFGKTKHLLLNEAKSVLETKDGGYILAGTTNSFGHGNEDAWLIKLKKKQEANKPLVNITGIPTTTQPKETVGFEALFGLAIVLIVSRIKTKAT